MDISKDRPRYTRHLRDKHNPSVTLLSVRAFAVLHFFNGVWFKGPGLAPNCLMIDAYASDAAELRQRVIRKLAGYCSLTPFVRPTLQLPLQ